MVVLYNGSLIDFIKRIFDVYNGDTAYLYYYAFFIAIIVILFVGGRYYSSVFVYPVLLFFVAVFNPVSVGFFNEMQLIPTGRFYRFLWIPPVVTGIVFSLTLVIYKLKNKTARYISIALACAVLIILGNPSETIQKYQMATNIYKIPQFIIDISECIHNDYGDGTPTLYYDDNVLFFYRTYDLNTISFRGRGETIGDVTDEQAKAIIEQGVPHSILDLVIFQNKKHLISNTNVCMYLTPIDYIICKQQEGNIAYYTEIGMKYLGVFDGYEVYRNTNKAKE